MAPLHYAAKLDPFLSLDCNLALHPGAIQGKEGIKFCHLATLPAPALGGHVAAGISQLLQIPCPVAVRVEGVDPFFGQCTIITFYKGLFCLPAKGAFLGTYWIGECKGHNLCKK